ncbi:MAG TPA: DUF6029 family protein [Ignavibacteria bacterium]|nr:DUF6029 family protein [Ignavibacteria bacterium]
MKKLLSLALLLLVSSIGVAQIKLDVKASLNNVMRYGSGTERNNNLEYGKEYFENLSDARLSVNDIIFGMRYEISQPIEYGVDYKGIRKRFIEYNNVKEGINVRAGDFWEVISRGLSMNVFEDRTQFYDTGIDGIKAFYKKTIGEKNPVKVKAEMFAGMLEYNDFANVTRKEVYNVRDANFEISPVKLLNIGANYVYAYGKVPTSSDTTSIKAYIPEGYLSFNYKNLQLFASYAHKHVSTDANTSYPVPISAKGDGFYGSLSYSMPKLGVTVDYKNYRFDMTNPDNRSADRPTKMLPFQNPPTVVKEHSSTLISRNPHVVDFNDEVGVQIDVVYAPKDNVTFNLNAAVASRHFDYLKTTDGGKLVYTRIERDGNYLPSLDKQFSPYWEVYADGEWYVNDKLYTKVAYDRQNAVTYNYINPNASEILKVNTIPVEVRYSLTKEYTLKFIVENQWVENNIRVGEKSYMNNLFSVSLSRSPNISATFSAEFTNDEEEPTGKKNWFIGEVSYKFNSANSLTVSYGTERGGLKCTNGICRFVRPFEGLRLTLNNKF